MTVERRAGSGFRIDGVVLAPRTPHLAVRPVHLHHLDPNTPEVPGETGAVAAGALHTNHNDRTERTHPVAQRPVTRGVAGEALGAQEPADSIDHCGDVDVPVCVNAADDNVVLLNHAGCLPSFLPVGQAPPAGTADRTLKALRKAPMRSRSPDRLVRAPGKDPADRSAARHEASHRRRVRPRPHRGPEHP